MFYVGLDLGKKHAGLLLVRDLVTSPALYGRCALAVDGAGVGEPVIEMFCRTGMGCEVTAVTITGAGKRRN